MAGVEEGHSHRLRDNVRCRSARERRGARNGLNASGSQEHKGDATALCPVGENEAGCLESGGNGDVDGYQMTFL